MRFVDTEESKREYKEFLEKPGSHKAHKYLHTTYTKKKKYDI